jgi:uncharacterized Zn finger protein
LAERAGDGTRITCGRCGVVNETLSAIRAESQPQIVISEGAIALTNRPPTRVVFDRDESGRMTGVHDEPLVN